MKNFFRNRKLILDKLNLYVDKRDSLIVYSQYGVGIKTGCWDEYHILDRAIKRLWKLYSNKKPSTLSWGFLHFLASAVGQSNRLGFMCIFISFLLF